MKALFQRKKAPELPPEIAEQILQNAFDLCVREPNSVPLETLVSYSGYRRERYSLQRGVIVCMLALFLLLPLLFIAPKLSVTPREDAAAGHPVYDLTVSTRFPIRQVRASIDGRTVPVTEAGDRVYRVQPERNGELTLTATLVNRQTAVETVTVSGADAQPPTLISTENGVGVLILTLSDDLSGVDYASVTVTAPDGTVSGPESVDPDKGEVVVPYPETYVDVSVSDNAGNERTLRLSPSK